MTHAKCDYTLQAWISSNGKGREGQFRPGVALFKAPHYKLRRLLPSAWNDSQICGLLKRYCRPLVAAILPELFENLLDTYFPIQRYNYYDGNGRHWKTKLFEHIVTIDNIPKPLRVRMLDLQRNHSTEVTISEICYDVEYLTKEDFNPAKLPEAMRSPICTVKSFQKK